MIGSVVISGAGIAGPVLASLLARRGISVTVLEIADGVRPGGQAVDLRGAGRTVLERMGLLERARSMALDRKGIADVDGRGKHLSEMRVTDFGGEGIISEIEILRGDLADLLVGDSIDHGVEYLFGTRITALADRGDRVRVDLSDGSARDVDLVIGADGPHSATRRLVFGPEEQFVDPLGGYMAWFTCPEGQPLNGWYVMYNRPGGLAASLRPGRTPGTAKASLSFTSPPLRYDRHDIGGQRDLLAGKFDGAGWRIAELVAAARSADDFYLDALVQVHRDTWSHGRIALVGDAAYCPSPLTGLGTSLALVGAWVLAGELTAGHDHVAAFARYEELVRPYVGTAQKLPPGGIRSYAPRSAPAIRLRIATTRLMVSRLFRGLAAKVFFGKADAIALPGYGQSTRDDAATSNPSFTTTIRLDRPPEEVFDAIIDPSAWWSNTIGGDAGRVGAEFQFDSPGHHLWKFEVVEARRPTTVGWRVTDDSSTDFVADPTEWNGTVVRFRIIPDGTGSRLRFTHDGLVPQFECFEACSLGWTGYIQQSLRALIDAGRGQPGRY